MVSQSLDRPLGLTERWRLYMHLRVCEACRNFRTQMDFLRKAARKHPAVRQQDE